MTFCTACSAATTRQEHGVLSYSDPVVRRRLDGSAILPGHVGAVCQALGAAYHGRGERRRYVLTPEGEIVSERGWQKLRNGERGGEGMYRRLLAWGAPPIRPGESSVAYADRALVEGPFRALPHPGNHVYTWAFGRGVAQAAALPYPRRAA